MSFWCFAVEAPVVLKLKDAHSCAVLSKLVIDNDGTLRNLEKPIPLEGDLKAKIVAGGRLGNGKSLGTKTGNGGGAFRALVTVNGQDFYAAEKILEHTTYKNQVDKPYELTDPKILQIIELNQLAHEAGMAPRVLGWVKYQTPKKSGALMYIEEVGSSPDALHFPDGKPFALTLRELFKPNIQVPPGFDVQRDFHKKTPIKEIRRIQSVHPDYHDNNIIFDFIPDPNGGYTPRAYGIDWVITRDIPNALNSLHRLIDSERKQK